MESNKQAIDVAYTYYLCWPELDLHYYGVRLVHTLSPDKDFWNAYKSSSKHVKCLLESGKVPSVRRVHKTFEAQRQAWLYERRFLKCVLRKAPDKWLNKWSTTPVAKKKHTKETCQKISEAKRNISDETRMKMRLAKLGIKRVLTDEHRQKISEAKKGIRTTVLGEDSKKKLSASLKGKPKPPRSEEHRRNLSKANTKHGRYKQPDI
jgi:NUMOD3 motif-containing protein